jgi:hypothetical protein
MLCIICRGICDPTPTRMCVNCQKEVDRVNERALLMYLLKESYRYVPHIWLRRRIEDVFERDGTPLEPAIPGKPP